MRIEILAEEVLAAHAAAVVASVLGDAVEARGRATVAFSGGSTARPLLAALAATTIPWEAIDVLQVDERVAPPGHADRNLTGLQELLAARVPALRRRVHPMPVEDDDLQGAAARYARTLRDLAGTPARLDLVHLGIGVDGHTASLLPGSPLLVESAPVGVTATYEGRRRMTLTLPVLNRAREIVWLVRGAAKAPMVRRLVDGDASIPAGRVDRAHARLLLDHAAAAELSPETLTGSS